MGEKLEPLEITILAFAGGRGRGRRGEVDALAGAVVSLLLFFAPSLFIPPPGAMTTFLSPCLANANRTEVKRRA